MRIKILMQLFSCHTVKANKLIVFCVWLVLHNIYQKNFVELDKNNATGVCPSAIQHILRCKNGNSQDDSNTFGHTSCRNDCSSAIL